MSWDFFTTRTVKAAKVHPCAECGARIAVGETHGYHAGKVEGEFASYRLCAACDLIVAEAHRAGLFEEGWPLGELRSELAGEHGIDEALSWAQAQQGARIGRKLMLRDAADAAAVLQGGAA